MRPPNLRVPKIVFKRLPLARCLIAFYVVLFLVFSSLLGLLVMPFPSTLSPAYKRQNNKNTNGGGGSCGRDVEWLMFKPNPVNQSTISVCARLGGLAAVGGLESWFWALQEYVFTSDRFRLHAVNLEALHYFDAPLDRFYYSRSSVARILESSARLNIGPEEIIDECDVVLSSWVDPPLRPPPDHPQFKSILIIHGSDAIENEATWMYAHQLNAYDATVCVSAGCMDAYGPAENSLKPLHYIPSSIDLAKYDPTADKTRARAELNLPLGKGQKILGFLGRIAEDKNPQLFVDVVAKLPKYRWMGAMAGPLYLPEQMVSNLTLRVHLLGDVQEPWKFLAAVDALYVPSHEEGGPIVLLEAWATGKPFFIRRTGLAVDHEDGVFIIPDDATPESIAQLIDEKISNDTAEDGEVEEKIKYGLKTVKEQFSSDVLREKYHSLMENLLENNEEVSNNDSSKLNLGKRLPFQVYYPTGEAPSQEAVQLTRRGRTLWARCFYKHCLFYVKFSPSSLETTSSTSRKVTVVVRTFSASLQSGVNFTTADGGVVGFLRPEKGTEKLASIEGNTARQSIHLTLPTNIFGVQLFDGHAVQILDVLDG